MISGGVPYCEFGLQGVEIWDAAVEALSGEGSEFNFGHVEPRAVFWGMVYFEAGQQAAGLFRFERLVECGRLVGIEIVADQDHLSGYIS